MWGNVAHYYCKARIYQGCSQRTGLEVRNARDPESAVRALRRLGVQAIFFQDSEQPWYALFKPEAVARHFRNVASAGGWHSCVWASPQAATAGKPPAKQ